MPGRQPSSLKNITMLGVGGGGGGGQAALKTVVLAKPGSRGTAAPTARDLEEGPDGCLLPKNTLCSLRAGDLQEHEFTR